MEQTAFWISSIVGSLVALFMTIIAYQKQRYSFYSRKRKGWIALGIGLCFGLIAGGCSFLIQTTPVTVKQQIEPVFLFKQPSTKTTT